MAGASIILGIEVSNPSAGTGRPGVVVARDEGGTWVEAGRASIDPARTHEDQLMQAAARACEAAGVRPRDLGVIAVSIGPGGFTAVRIAVVAAKMLAEATGATCVGVPSAMALGWACAEPGPIAIALASKGESAWGTVLGPRGSGGGGDGGGGEGASAGIRRTLVPGRIEGAAFIDEAARHGARVLVADGFVPVAWRERAEELGLAIQPPISDPMACVWAAAMLTADGRADPDRGDGGHAGEVAAFADPAMLLPIYPREPEAVTKWRALHGGGTGGGTGSTVG